jgi:carbamoyl-phosphate synthase small subunit
MAIATLVLEDGSVYEGMGFGASSDAVFELVFNTGMTGYQEVLTDPSYRGQGVLFTAPHIGNVGVNAEDYESAAPQVAAVALRALSPVVSNWRASGELSAWLAGHGVPGIAELDTRAITVKLRDGGTQRAALSTRGTPPTELLAQARGWPGLDGRDMVREVTCTEAHHWSGDAGDAWVTAPVTERASRPRLVLYDFGSKRNILRHLAARGAAITVAPAMTTWQEALALQPDGVVLSNGPGDPAGLPYAVTAVKGLLESGIPVLGICLGHQLLGLASGGHTSRLKFGHHGINHPVQDLRSGAIQITSQNHNYCVEPESMDASAVEITHVSLYDGSVEGMRRRDCPAFSVQYHPEAAAGPHDTEAIFDEFFRLF